MGALGPFSTGAGLRLGVAAQRRHAGQEQLAAHAAVDS